MLINSESFSINLGDLQFTLSHEFKDIYNDTMHLRTRPKTQKKKHLRCGESRTNLIHLRCGFLAAGNWTVHGVEKPQPSPVPATGVRPAVTRPTPGRLQLTPLQLPLTAVSLGLVWMSERNISSTGMWMLDDVW